MKKKILFSLLLMLVFVCVLALSASAAVYKINFDNKGTVETDENGTITLKDKHVHSLNTTKYTIKDADGNDVTITQQFLGWYTEDGRVFAPGETVTFTEDTYLYQASGATVYNYDDLNNLLGRGWWCIKLGADIEATSRIKTCHVSGTMAILDLNGHNITTSASDAFSDQRSGLMIVGEGTITHTGKGRFFSTSYHSYNPDNIRVSIGQNVTVTTNCPLFYSDNDLSGKSGIPKVKVWGNATVGSLLNVDKVYNAIIAVYEGANLTVTGSDPMVFRNETGANAYANITLSGNIKITNPDAILLDDFILTNKFGVNAITSGSFTVSSKDAERIAMFLPDTLMLKPTENADGTTTYNVVEADCVHDWVLDTEATVAPAPGVTGLDVFNCSKCGTGKQAITVYSPSSVEITVVVRTEEGDKEYTVLAGDVYDFQYNGIGAAALCYIAGLKDTADFTADMIVSIEVPAGVAEFTGFNNSTLETVSILDGATVKVYTLDKLTALKTINVGKANVTFDGLVKSKLEKISNKVEGATLTFAYNCFYKGASIKSLEMCAGSTYKFSANSFRECGLTELIFPDNSTISWGNNAFAECQQLEYIYIGSNIGVKTINNDSAIFDGISNLKKVVIMDLTYLGQWAFSTKEQGKDFGPKCDLTMYIHSEALTMNANAFNNRKGNYHVFIYTVQTTLPSTINNCNRVIYQGIGHAYTSETIVPSTCVTKGTAGFVTDCPCGIDYRENAYTSYSSYDSSLNNVAYEPFGTATFELPLSEEHTLSDIIKSVEYKNGFLSLGTKTFKCLYCDEAVSTEEEASFPVIFSFNGYSVPEDGELAITVGYSVNLEALNEYEAIMGELEFGVVAAIAEKLNGKAPLDASDVPVLKVKINGNYASFDFIMKGFNEAQLDLALVMCAYVYDGTKYVYLQEAQVESPEAVSINSILANK